MEAGKVWNDMTDKGFKPNIVAHHTMLEGLLRCRKRSDAIKLFEVMKSKGPYPSARSYTILIRDLCKQMKMKEAVEYFEDMLDYGNDKGMKAPQLDYNKFAADFSRIGKPDILEELSQKMKFLGKFEASNLFGRWAKMMRNRVKRRDPVKNDKHFA
ncbi:Pentatricopeptide repeat-containing protein [Camellia lanceoleosa]|uniref:Pentatricopeptide repeat-containing protein n=1 Tax=Camellia lanceoleosa TaxID=1840588 RepID=A0ACC0FS27_9ERIC|nr:Pentatricopeptide repeat-containing protein [Camellia lanceoleosa]